MSQAEKIIHNGIAFYKTGKNRYYISGKKGGERYLHRLIWIEANGPIDPRMEVHHKNEITTDNRLENLEIVDRLLHRKVHTKERMADREKSAANWAGLEKARIAAENKSWHTTPEGIAFFKENGRKSWEGRVPDEATCQHCGNKYTTLRKSQSKFCSISCAGKASYLRRKTEKVNTCKTCGKQFMHHPQFARVFCSVACSNRWRPST